MMKPKTKVKIIYSSYYDSLEDFINEFLEKKLEERNFKVVDIKYTTDDETLAAYITYMTSDLN